MLFRKSRIICFSTVSILLLSILPLANNQTITTGEISEYQEIINSLYELKEDNFWSETAYERSNRT